MSLHIIALCVWVAMVSLFHKVNKTPALGTDSGQGVWVQILASQLTSGVRSLQVIFPLSTAGVIFSKMGTHMSSTGIGSATC